MGVPGFFSWLLKKNRTNMLKEILQDRPKILYLDSNCFFHPQCFKVLETYTGTDVESAMIKQIIRYMEHIIKFVNPSEKIFIGVDGVAPIAKINQQRKRRYKSVIDKEIIDKIKLKYNILPNNNWTNASITPGTEFMEKIHQEILKYISDDERFIYSSYHEPCEGEHKILSHIKKNKFEENENIVIYGLDSDLIFLSMVSNKNNIYLLREGETFNYKEHEFVYVDIDSVKQSYYKYVINKLPYEKKYLINNICNDFVFISYLIGNDFVPHILSLDIKNKGLDVLINCYIIVLFEMDKYLLNGSINMEFLKRLFYYLTKEEINFFLRPKKNYIPPCPYNNPMEIEIWNHENIIVIENDPIKIGQGDPKVWKRRYYEHYFTNEQNKQYDVNEICKSYLNGLSWILKYYFNECPSWIWQYKYFHAPFISDIYNFLVQTNYNLNNVQFELRKPLSQHAQLLAVTPPVHKHLLPEKYRKLMENDSPIIDMFPTNIKIDTLYKSKWWLCIPMLPCIDIDRIEMFI